MENVSDQKILVIDNYDSFTYNVVQYLSELGAIVEVHRNDEIGLREIEELTPDKIVISPGPCTPNEAGISVDCVTHFSGQIPLLGICLGHQSIGQAFGGKVIQAREVMHGKTSLIHHDNEGVFKDLPNPFEATRYHSLIIEKSSLPNSLQVSAWTGAENQVDEIMGIRHKDLTIEGVQFHPESILTLPGHNLLRNFLNSTQDT